MAAPKQLLPLPLPLPLLKTLPKGFSSVSSRYKGVADTKSQCRKVEKIDTLAFRLGPGALTESDVSYSVRIRWRSKFVCSLAPFQVVEGVGTASVSGSCPRLVPFKAADSVEAPKRVTSAAPDAADARFKAVLKAALIQRLLLLLSLSLVLNLLHFFLSKLNRLQPSY